MLVKASEDAFANDPNFQNSGKLFQSFREELAALDHEHFFMLDGNNRTIGYRTISLGSLSSSVVHPRDVFKPGILTEVRETIEKIRATENDTCLKHIYIVESQTDIVEKMGLPKLTKLELQIMEALWNQRAASIREIQEAFPERDRPAYTTIQTTVYRLEVKKAVRRVKKISNAHIFEAVISRGAAQGRLIDDLLGLFGGRAQPVMAHLIESGKLNLDDVKEAEKALRKLAKEKEKA
jgi:predicted transcriptional regulator